MRKVASEHSLCALIYMNSYIFHICFILFILLSYLIFDFVCLTSSSAYTHGIAKYARTYIRDIHTQAHTQKKEKSKSRKIRKIRKKKKKKIGKLKKKKEKGRKERKKEGKKKGRTKQEGGKEGEKREERGKGKKKGKKKRDGDGFRGAQERGY